MSKSYLGGFVAADKHYRHFINTSDDGTTIEDEKGNVVFSVNSSAYVFDDKTKWIGNFYMNDKYEWYFKDKTTNATVDFNSGDLLKCEREWAKALIERGEHV